MHRWLSILFVVGNLIVLNSMALARSPSRPDVEWPDLALLPIAGEYTRPVYVTHAGDGSGRLFVVERSGTIKIVQNGNVLSTHFLDIAERVDSTCGECGLLGLAFPPGFGAKQWFFVYYNSKTNLVSPSDPNEPDGSFDSVIARFRVSDDPNLADPDSEERVLVVNQPYNNHNGGQVTFGPDGTLYIGLGDGGDAGDPLNTGQRLDTLLGKILRIQVGATGTYTIPDNNPFAESDSARPEIWAWGLRNPWRFAFDRATGDLYIGDVGQYTYEEIDFQPAASPGGENYGWKVMEGLHCYKAVACDETDLVAPVAEYDHTQGNCSVTGGVVYRGLFPALQGIYLFGDFCSGRIWGLQRDGADWQRDELLDVEFLISSFGEDEAGHAYVVDYDGRVYLIVNPNYQWPFHRYLPDIRR